MQRVLFFLVFIFSFWSGASIQKMGNGPWISVQPEIQSELKSLVDEATKLHQELLSGNRFSLEKQINALQEQIRQIYIRLPLIKRPQTKDHTFRLLSIIDEKLEGLKVQGKGIGKSSVKKLFGTVAELARTYHLKTASNNIFYCSQDKSLWLQSGNKPKNPVNPHLRSCGRKVW